VVAFLKRWAGYALSGSTKEHCILFIHGPGGNGKSVFVDTIRYAWGEYAKTLPMDALMESKGDRHPAEIAMLKGARLAIANETQEGRKWDDAKLKQLTGGDVVVARHMRQDWFEFTPCFKLLVVGNHAPQIAVVDDAMRRRLCMVPFTNKPEKPDGDLGAKLREEAGGVLRWAMEGFEEWATLGGLRPPESILKATAGYLDDQDTVGAWLQDCTVKQAGSFTSSRAIMASWSTWCTEAGTHPKSMKRLGPDLKSRGYVQTRTEHARGFLGLTLLTHPDTLADAS
jgi:putative DNA primase/helicase